MERPRYYIQDLVNYTDDFLREIILWQEWKIEELGKINKEEIENEKI